ncbi:marine proteobacterial sortase target protein [Thalassovita autumnalis]|jgi:hypothetical protein|uniref:Marine proteobacterial sortase target protein n=1 Tax=Thalassovita autumnalis TaxID=2072972 RepID=A0A0P1G767_9RHOB|nr:VWA domain-containing protein [Thalassovita autumnalis]CUH70193.1 marine proteobacterial sortase target protein [Thalassovita autumnalis]CUH71877.1 marine proteobacterial sortase target protein [Thalassovita autumnalis]
MICEADLRPFFDGIVACDTSLWLASQALIGLGIAVVLAVVVERVAKGSASLSSWRLCVSSLFFMLSIVLLGTALRQPEILRLNPKGDAAQETGLVVALIDSSESVWRNPDAAKAAIAEFAKHTGALTDRMLQQNDGINWRGEALQFGSAVDSITRPERLGQLPINLAAVRPQNKSDQSNGALALQTALAKIKKTGGRGAILLLSDGHFDHEVKETTYQEARSMGVPIYWFAYGSQSAGGGIVSADIGPTQYVNAPATLRLTGRGQGVIQLSQFDAESAPVTLDSAVLSPVRADTVFNSRGLHYVSALYSEDAVTQSNTVFTMVRGPARVLAYGGAPWADLLPQERWLIERADPSAPVSPDQYDLVVLDSVTPQDFPSDYLNQLVAGLGKTSILLINGGLRGDVTDPQRISDWNESVLSPYLPVDSNPRAFIEKPPARNVVIMIDTSGSMSDTMSRARAAANAVLDQLAEHDRFAILPFSSQAGREFSQRVASAGNISAARRFIDALSVGGGTAPSSTLSRAAQLRSNYCAYFFISDGYFETPSTSPQCYTTSISTSGDSFPAAVAGWGEEILLRSNRAAANIKLSYFEPKERAGFFREGGFTPTPLDDLALLSSAQVDGIAIAYPRVDATVWSIHETPPPDPVLAVRRGYGGQSGAVAVFLGAIPARYSFSKDSAMEVGRAMDELIGWNDQDRYDIEIELSGGTTKITVTVLSQGNADEIPTHLGGRIATQNGRASGLNFVNSGREGVFHAMVNLDLNDKKSFGYLILEEPSKQAQRIPLFLPAKTTNMSGDRAEALDFGANVSKLAELGSNTYGGRIEQAHFQLHQNRNTPPLSMHAWLIAIALISLSVALWSGRIE